MVSSVVTCLLEHQLHAHKAHSKGRRPCMLQAVREFRSSVISSSQAKCPHVTENTYAMNLKVEVAWSCLTLLTHELPARLLCQEFSDQNTGKGYCSLHQGIFPTQDRTQISHKWILYQLSHRAPTG